MSEHRIFYVAELLNGDLHIYRENHKGGGLTAFIEYTSFYEMKSRAEKAESENIELKEKNDLYLSMLDDERANSKKNWLNLKSDLATKTAAVEELVSISQRAMRQWHMHMTDLQQEDLDDLLKDENNHEAHDYKNLFELLTKHAKGT